MQLKRYMLAVAGPTAVGKSAVALRVAERLGGEIISVDSMQVYRGLDIGTAKPTNAEQARVRHHLIDVLDLSESFDAQRFYDMALAALQGIRQQNRLPILCGGSGLYFKALWFGLGKTPPPDPQLRSRLEQQPVGELLDELRRQDPEAYEMIDRANKRRVVRALEVIRMTGEPYSRARTPWQKIQPETTWLGAFGFQVCFVGLRRQGADLNTRIEQRVEKMFREGLVEETQKLLGQGLDENPTARNALGYRQVIDYLKGNGSREETETAVKMLTRQFAKRQMTWFRHQLPVAWLDIRADEQADETAGRVIQWWQARKEEAPSTRP